MGVLIVLLPRAAIFSDHAPNRVRPNGPVAILVVAALDGCAEVLLIAARTAACRSFQSGSR